METNFTPDRPKLASAPHSQADELQQLYEIAPCGYHSLDENGLYLRINQTELQMLGYTWDEIVGKIRFVDILTPESQLKFQANFPAFKERGFVKDLEFEMVRQDGSTLPISLSATVILDDDGNFVMTRSIVIDISERKRSEAERKAIESELQKSQHFVEQILNTIPDRLSIYSIDQRRIIYTNRSLGGSLGYPPAEIDRMGDRIIDILRHPDEPNPADLVVALEDGEIREFEHRMRHFSGEWQWQSLRYTNFDRQDDGHVDRVLVLVHDITQSKQAELELQRTEERLRYLLTANPAVIYACEASEGFLMTFVSENVSRMLGYQSWDFLADPHFWTAQIHPEDRDRVFTDLAQIIDLGAHVYEYRFRHQDGDYIWVRDELRLILDSNGKPLEIIGYWSDINTVRLSRSSTLLSVRVGGLWLYSCGFNRQLSVNRTVLGVISPSGSNRSK